MEDSLHRLQDRLNPFLLRHDDVPSTLCWESKMLRARSAHNISRSGAKLPIYAYYNQIVRSVRLNPVTILQADTGSGKRLKYFVQYV